MSEVLENGLAGSLYLISASRDDDVEEGPRISFGGTIARIRNSAIVVDGYMPRDACPSLDLELVSTLPVEIVETGSRITSSEADCELPLALYPAEEEPSS